MENDSTIQSGNDAPVLIDRFTGPWEFLSNYYPAAVRLDGAWYPAVENAYQAAKTRDPEVRERIAAADPDEAKRLGRLSLDQPGWEEMKVAVMRGLAEQKFRDERMRRLLLSTGTAELVEGNDWGDDFWGMCGGRGQNFMGLILMAVRAWAVRDAAGPVPVIAGGGAAGVGLAARASIPTVYGPFTAWAYRGVLDGSEHLALTAGNVRGAESVLVRVHSECLTGEALGSLRCDCGPQLDAALAAVAGAGTGVVLYMRGHEGRGIGLLAKLRAYALQDAGFDTVDANSAMGLPQDARDYRAAARILADLGSGRSGCCRTTPPRRALTALGIKVTEQLPLITPSNQHNIGYLMTKWDRMGHELPGLPGQDRLAGLVT
ncbi:MAG TPA: GTP cyclohydrolase II RibA [Streptosporangiaceae bacterium]|nr:GTP cyclohydrolase II RibA [Streptosporangiaceae bacterium]HVB46114.1 GTP cyclohydrolase II RibA [Streptosporangiaceae bacterium]